MTDTNNSTDDAAESDASINPGMYRNDIPLDVFHTPGTMFRFDGVEFLTTDVIDGSHITVVRIDSGDQIKMHTDELEQRIQNHEISLLNTYNLHSDVALPRTTVATLADYVTWDIEEIPDRVTDDEREAADTAHSALE